MEYMLYKFCINERLVLESCFKCLIALIPTPLHLDKRIKSLYGLDWSKSHVDDILLINV